MLRIVFSSSCLRRRACSIFAVSTSARLIFMVSFPNSIPLGAETLRNDNGIDAIVDGGSFILSFKCSSIRCRRSSTSFSNLSAAVCSICCSAGSRRAKNDNYCPYFLPRFKNRVPITNASLYNFRETPERASTFPLFGVTCLRCFGGRISVPFSPLRFPISLREFWLRNVQTVPL